MNALRLSYLFLSFSVYATISFSADIDIQEYLLFIGNPGVGKSTTINSLIGKTVAQSGISPGSGLTKFFSAYEHDGRRYFDTPGLADVKLREQAASEIENALKKNGTYRLFFVITLEALRVKPEDVTTINTVMDAIKCEKNFNVIINKLTKQEKNKIESDALAMAQVYASVNSGKHKTDSIWYIARDRDLEDGDKVLFDVDKNLNNFVFNKSLSIRIDAGNVEKIKTDEFEEIKAQFESSLSILRKQIDDGKEEHKALITKMTDLQTSLKDAKKAAEDAEKKNQDRDNALKQAIDDANRERQRADDERRRREAAESGGCTIL